MLNISLPQMNISVSVLTYLPRCTVANLTVPPLSLPCVLPSILVIPSLSCLCSTVSIVCDRTKCLTPQCAASPHHSKPEIITHNYMNIFHDCISFSSQITHSWKLSNFFFIFLVLKNKDMVWLVRKQYIL